MAVPRIQHQAARALAEQVLADVRTLAHDEDSLPSRPAFDRLLLTAHQRVKPTREAT